MEPFRGKASGKTAHSEHIVYNIGCVDCWSKQRDRIAELEAELEAFHGKPSGKTVHGGTGMDPLEAAQLSRWDLYHRIKNLEAEVERLQRRIAELERLLTLSSSPLTHQGEPGVNPSGDTLGKERDDG